MQILVRFVGLLILLLIGACLWSFFSRPLVVDPFRLANGQLVKTLEEWSHQREMLLRRVQEDIYGFAPTAKGVLISSDSHEPTEKYPWQSREIEIQIGDPRLSLKLQVLALIPPEVQSAPVLLALNKCGNHTLYDDPRLQLDIAPHLHPDCLRSRGSNSSQWNIDDIIKSGFALVTFSAQKLVPDDPSARSKLMDAFPNLDADTRWGAIRAWAWLLSRVVDVLQAEPVFDARRIVLTGHSRRAKAALLATALDNRVAMVAAHQAGTFGTASADNFLLESRSLVAWRFPHWLSPRGRTHAVSSKEVIDQDGLLALIAPRAIFDSEGCLDVWASYWASLDTLKKIDFVYQLYERSAFGKYQRVWSVPDDPKFNGKMLQYLQCPTGHVLNRDFWRGILAFAKSQFSN